MRFLPARANIIVVLCVALAGCESDEFRYEFNLLDVDDVVESATVEGFPMKRDADIDRVFRFDRSYRDFVSARENPPRGLSARKTSGETVSSDETIFNPCSNPALGTVVEMTVDFAFHDSAGFVAVGGQCLGTDGEQHWVN